eukprot:TRINITY_DN465_c0_g3_i1.p1 TRINITY_DN465_c0_g3~~TRINITY_DN465_c0_g3_i1.p1  ORF type:complete len:278 (+),score=30.92 TRINITY_DN465_c0_g3_i1:355-1188(+)
MILAIVLLFCVCLTNAQTCLSLDSFSGDYQNVPGCNRCITGGCSYCTVNIGSVRYGCEPRGTTTCAGVVSGGTKSFYNDVSACDCPGDTITTTEYYPNVKSQYLYNGNANSTGYLYYYVSGPISFQVYPRTVTYSLNLFTIAKSAAPYACPTSLDSVPVGVNKTTVGTLKQLDFPAGDYVIALQITNTGIADPNNYNSDSIAVKSCVGSPCPAPCDGKCALGYYCQSVGTCVSGCVGKRYTCCPENQPYDRAQCTSNAYAIYASAFALILVVASVLF